ncbi:MAG: DNA polymerase III subunit alpha [Trueperaceae bacterium]|nr:DNA polymerase III subunit alpha [Trueperaceae bacterium]
MSGCRDRDLGFEAYVTAGSRHERKKPSSKLDGGYFHLTLLAKNFVGYQNLCKLNSRAWLEGFYMKPRVDHELLREYSEGVIALSGCLGAQIPRTLLDAGEETGEQTLRQYLDIFGDNFFIELQNHVPDNPVEMTDSLRDLTEQQTRLNPMLRELATKYGLGMVATNDGHYVKKEDAKAHEALLAIQTKTTLSDEKRFRFPCEEFYVKTPEEMARALPESEFENALSNTMVVADLCDITLPVGKNRVYQMPELPIPAGRTLAEQLRVQTYQGLIERYDDVDEALFRRYLACTDETAAGDDPEAVLLAVARVGERGRHPKGEDDNFDTYVYPHLDTLAERAADYGIGTETLGKLERAEYELGVIIAMGFPDYFLIVADFINWAKDHGIAVGPGRGSGAGSIVAYATRITNIDPLAFDLLFERFLNPDRVSMPDFDIDFSDTRRMEVVDYVREKYGEDRVAQIATFGTMASKAAIRDAARVLEAPYSDADKVSKLIPVVFGRSTPIAKALEEVAEFRDLYETTAKEFVDVAMSLEGLTRHASVHAAGVIIAREPIQELAPVFRSGDGPVVCQYDMGSVEDLGFIKMDFLGLRTLSFIEAAVRIIRDSQGETLDPDAFVMDDEATFALLSRGEAAGVFQFESPGMVDTLRKLKPRRIQDLIAVSALYRPGPMENIPTYIRRHHGQEEVDYSEFPVAEAFLAPILAETYGIPVYQEQIMQIAQAVAGYSLGEADLLRRAMGKKKVEEMNKQRVIFLGGAGQNGIPKQEANGIFDLLEKFANYGFNKSHSAAYAMLSYQTAYLKAHYPVAFTAALLSVERANSDKVAQYVGDARHLGIEVSPPDINESRADFTPVGEVVRFGLYGIKNVGDAAVEHILAERQRGGNYKDLYDFCRRVDSSLVNKRALEHLIKAGAFDATGDRAVLLANLEPALKWGAAQRSQAQSGQIGLFGAEETKPPAQQAAAVMGKLERLRLEKEALGLYISDHPMNSYPGLAAAASCSVDGLEDWFGEQRQEQSYKGRLKVVLAGLIENVQKKATRKGTMMARFDLADETGSREVVAFSHTYDAIAPKLVEDSPAVLVAEVSDDEGSFRLVAEKLISWEERGNLPHLAVIRFGLEGITDAQLGDLRSWIDELSDGETVPLQLELTLSGQRVQYQTDNLRIGRGQLDMLEHHCPWLSTALTLDRQSLLKGSARPRWGEAAPTASGAEAPF